MQFQLRIPLGILFALYGAMLMLYGFFSDPAVYARSLGLNVNLGWGSVLLVFGLVLLLRRPTRPRDRS
jgi:hypothetical protein